MPRQPTRAGRKASKLSIESQQELREQIKAGELINLLHNYALSGKMDGEGDPHSRINAARFLLSLKIPQLKAMEVSGEQTHKLVLEWNGPRL